MPQQMDQYFVGLLWCYICCWFYDETLNQVVGFTTELVGYHQNKDTQEVYVPIISYMRDDIIQG